MFMPKIEHALKLKNPSIEDMHKFTGWIDQYYNATKHIPRYPIPKDEQIVLSELPTAQSLVNFLNIIGKHYHMSKGDSHRFKQSLSNMQPKLPPNHPDSLIVNHQPNQLYRLFNILSVPPIQTPKLITFSQWDKLLSQIVLSWCVYHNQTIDLKSMFQIIDQVNGDFPTP